MAHFAEIVDGIVTRVVVVHNNDLLDNGVESEAKGKQFCENLFGGEWVQTSYNNNPIEGASRGKYAGFGDIWDNDRKAFYIPQPYPSWTLDGNHQWQPPTPYPSDGERYRWSEEDQEWVAI